MTKTTNAQFTVGQQVKITKNPEDVFFKAMTGQSTLMHGLNIGDVTTITSIHGPYEPGEDAIGIMVDTNGFDFDRDLFSDGPHKVSSDWIEAV